MIYGIARRPGWRARGATMSYLQTELIEVGVGSGRDSG